MLDVVKKHAEEKGVPVTDGALKLLSDTLEELSKDILEGAEKIRGYAGKEKVDEEAIKIASYLDVRLKKLF